MAFTTEEKEKICRHIGWPFQALIPNTIFYNSYLSQWILDLEYTTSMQDSVRTFLTRIDNIDQKLQLAINRLSADSVGHSEIRMNKNEITDLRAEKRRVIRELKTSLNAPEYD